MTKENKYNNVRTFLACGLFLLAVICSSKSTQAATLTVTSNGDQTINTAGCNDGCTLREAITAASSGDTITFDANLAGKTIILSGTELTVNKSLTIINNNSPLVAISGNHKSRVFNITAASVELDGLIIKNGKVVTTTSDADGGGVIATFPITIKNCIVTGNSITSSGDDAEGGAIRTSGGSGAITNSIISGNIAVSSTRNARGGSIYGDFTITNSTVTGNSALSNSTNREAQGGGIRGIFTIIDSTISSNSATCNSCNSRGGGIYSSGITTITNSMISGNSTTASMSSDGGGIFGNFTLTDSTVSDNSATSTGSTAEGGGGWGSSFTITNSTISGNSATSFSSTLSQGGGIRGAGSISNSTITNNTGGSRGSGFYLGGNSSLQNTIIAQNTTGDIENASHTITSNGNNLVGNNQDVLSQFPAGSPNVNGDYVGTSGSPIDAMLSSLANNFGETATHAPMAGSLAINNGNNTGAPTNDQRGFPRIQGGTIDIGAYEFSGVKIARVTLPNGLTGINYNENTGAAGGTLPYTFSFTGTPPPGLTINSTTGKINGMPTMAGTFNFGVQVQDSNPLAEVGKDKKSVLAPNVAVQNFQIQVFAPTAAAVQLRGRVYAAKGRMLNRTLIVLTDSFGESKILTTNSFGYFNFNELRAGETYILEAYRKGYEFQARIITMDNSITDFEIRSLE